MDTSKLSGTGHSLHELYYSLHKEQKQKLTSKKGDPETPESLEEEGEQLASHYRVVTCNTKAVTNYCLIRKEQSIFHSREEYQFTKYTAILSYNFR